MMSVLPASGGRKRGANPAWGSAPALAGDRRHWLAFTSGRRFYVATHPMSASPQLRVRFWWHSPTIAAEHRGPFRPVDLPGHPRQSALKRRQQTSKYARVHALEGQFRQHAIRQQKCRSVSSMSAALNASAGASPCRREAPAGAR
jgi:hypothetical protein